MHQSTQPLQTKHTTFTNKAHNLYKQSTQPLQTKHLICYEQSTQDFS
ncbi:hypothetical protein HPHPP23_1585 [Helicobacter pylori Hp P-23]|nr:hypothetical protein HPHPP23_1585 [Helicobacter pylori Hp P-23]